MINVVIDTNVLVAALIKPGGPNRAALRMLLDPAGPFRIFYSSQMMDEYVDVLHRAPISLRGLTREADALIALVADSGEPVIPKFIPAIVYPDIDDRPFLEAAVYVEGMLLTNNIKDFPFLGVAVIAPEEFLTWCAAVGIG